MNYKIEVKTIEAVTVASIRYKGKYSDVGIYIGKIYEAVKALANEGGYAVIFDSASGPTMLYTNPRYDISDEVLQRLGYKN